MHIAGRIFFAGLIWVISVSIAMADEWKISGTLDQTVEYDDNINLSTDPSSVMGYLMNPSLTASWATASNTVDFVGRGDIRRYDDKRWDCETFSVALNQRYQRKSSIFSFSGDYAQSCSYSNQVSDTGILLPDNQTETYNLTPSWSWQWTALDQISLSPSYSKTVYTSSGGDGTTSSVGFRDNESYRINLSYNRVWTRRLNSSLFSFISQSIFSSADSTNKQNVFGFQFNSTYDLTRLWTVSAGAGLNWLERSSDNSLNTNDADSLQRTELYNLDLQYAGQRTNFSLQYSRRLQPSALGQVQEYNSIDSNYSYQLTRQLRISLDASYSQNETPGQSNFQSAADRSFYTGSVRLSWEFARDWQLSTHYRYRRQEFKSSGGALQLANEQAGVRDSNALMLQLNYNWDGQRIFH